MNSFSRKLSDYYELTKPGISFMATFSALGGFILGSHASVMNIKLFHCLLGTLLTAAGACILNMVFERELDTLMKRTQTRPLPQRRLKPGESMAVGFLFAFAGILYLSTTLNLLTGILGALSCSIYLYMYTPLKKITSLCTVVGAVAGALPPMMGWTAATGHLHGDGWTLFAILFLWQFPHFLSLAYLYRDDYAKAGLHMLPWLPGVSIRHSRMSLSRIQSPNESDQNLDSRLRTVSTIKNCRRYVPSIIPIIETGRGNDDFGLAMSGHNIPKSMSGNDGQNTGRSERVTGAWMAFSSAGLIFAGGLPTLLGQTGILFMISAFLGGILLTVTSMRFLWNPARVQAKNIFLSSLLYVPLLMVCVILDRWMAAGSIFHL